MKQLQYLLQSFRLLKENRLLSVISLLGTALAICMIMVIVILYMANTAGFRPEVNRSRTYYVTTALSQYKSNNQRSSFSNLSLLLGKACLYPLQKAEAVTLVSRNPEGNLMTTSMDESLSRSCQVIYTDTAFWKLFEFDFIEGKPFSPAAFTSGLREIVISEPVARALFGTTGVVGREMRLDFITYRVCGVVKEVSRFASKACADVWLPYTVNESLLEQHWSDGINGSFYSCILLKPGATRGELREELLNRTAQFNAQTVTYKADLHHQPRSQVEEWLVGGSENKADLASLYIGYALLLFVLLLVPALNLAGVTQTLMRKRMGELGVRRAFGASRAAIIRQVLTEHLAITLLGGALGFILSYVSLWLLRDWLLATRLGEATVSIELFSFPVFVAAFLFCLVMNLLSAGIPAWRLSRASITHALNG